MKRLLLLAAIALLSCTAAAAQNTSVTGNVTGPNGFAWANGTGHASLVCSGNAQAYIGTSPIPRDYPTVGLDSNGNFTQGLYDTAVMVDVQGGPISCNYVYSFTEQCGISSFKTNPLTGVTGIGPISLTAQINATVVNMSPQCTPNATGFLEQTVPSGATPIFNSPGDTLFNFTLTQNVISSTFLTAVPIGHGRVFQINICQDGTGHWTMTWPINVSLPSGYTLSAAPGSCSPVAFRTIDNGLTWQGWQIVGGGSSGGGGPLLQVNGVTNTLQTTLNMLNGTNTTITADGAGGVTINSTGGATTGANGTLQKTDGSGAHVASNFVEIGNYATIGDSVETKGPNPAVAVTLFGAVPVGVNLGAPFSPGVTATCTATSTTIPISGGGYTRYLNGGGIDLQQCGNAPTMSTPSAPTVTAAVAVAPGQSGVVASNPFAGSTTRCYVIVARDLFQGLTAKSAEACVNSGALLLGATPLSITSSSRSGQTVTVTTSAHTLPIGCAAGSCGSVHIIGTSDKNNFDGSFPLASVPDSTHFTYFGGLSSTNGATTSSTGGTFTYFNSDHLVLPPYTSGMWQYGIYEGASGAETGPVGVSLPNIAGISGQPTFYDWDYYGPTYGAAPNLPYFWPSTPPSAPVNQTLVTTVVSGGGTSTLTVANAPTSTPGGATPTLFDDCPGVQAANAFANNFTGGGGMMSFPAPISVPGVGTAYVFNSYCTLSGTVSQSANISLRDTMQFTGQWYGNLNPNSLCATVPQFGIEGHCALSVTQASPGIYFAGGSMRGTTVSIGGNSAIGMLHVNSGTSLFVDDVFASGSGLNTVLFYDFAPGVGFGWYFINTPFLSGITGTPGSTFTPPFISKGNTELNWDNVPGGKSAMYFAPASFGLTMHYTQRQETQSLAMCQMSFYNSGGNVGGEVKIEDAVLDTASEPLVCNFSQPGQLGMPFTISGTNGPSSSVPLVSGSPLQALWINGTNLNHAAVGQNINTHFFGSFGQLNMDHDTIIAATNSIYSSTAIPPAPTCGTFNLGPPYTQTLSASTFYYAGVYPNGGIGKLSAGCSSTGSNGSQQIQLGIPATLPGAIGYVFYNSAVNSLYGVNSSCAIPGTTAILSTSNIAYQNCGVAIPSYTTGGPTGFDNAFLWSPLFHMVEQATPSNPPAGSQYWYANISTHKLACITSSGADCSPSPVSFVSSITGDGALITNSGSTAPVTLTLGTAVGYGVWGNPTASTAAPNYTALTAWPTAAFPTLNQNTTGTAGGLTGCTAATAGDVCVWTGSAWVVFTGNSTGTQVFQENASGVPSWGSGASTTFEANGTPLSSASTVNFINSAATDGITLTFSNPGGAGNVQLGFTGTLTNAGLTNSSVTFNGTTVALGASGNIPIQTNTVNNTSLAGLNMLTSTANVAGLTVTPTNSATNQEKFEVSGIVNASHGGTGQDLSAGTGVVQDTSGTISVSTGLANGTTATTQTVGDNTTKVATDAFVIANAVNPMTTIGQIIGGGVSGALTAVGPGKTGQSVLATNGALVSFSSPSILDSTTVTSTPYVIACDSSTALADRGHTVPFDTGASVVTVPDSTTAGGVCAGMVLTVEDLNPSLTFNRSGSDTFTVLNGGSSPLTGQTSFTMTKGQYATLKQGSSLLWRVEIKTTAGVTSIATTSPITGGTITSTGTIACPTCVTSASSLTSTAFMTGAGLQASQTPNGSSTLDSSGNAFFAGTLGATGHVTFEGVTSTGAAGIGKLVFGTITGTGGFASVNTSGGLSNALTKLDCSEFAGTTDAEKIQACLVALYAANTQAGIADATGLTGLTWDANPFAAANLPASGELWLPPGDTVTSVPTVIPDAWIVKGIGGKSVVGSYGSNLKASSSWPVNYSTGTITKGTAGANDVITGSGTTWNSTNTPVGCAFVGGTSPNITYGIISVIGSTTSITLKWGTDVGTGAGAASAYKVNCPVVVMGGGGPSTPGAQFGIQWKNAGVDCANLASTTCSVGILNWYAQEQSVLDNFSVRNFNGVGVLLEGQAQNFGPVRGGNFYEGSSCSAGTIPLVVRNGSTPMYPIENLSISRGGCSTSPTVAIDAQTNNLELHSINFTQVVTGLSIGANISCTWCATAPRLTNGVHVEDMRNESASGTTLVHISNAFGTPDSITLNNLQMAGITNSLIDDANNCTITNTRVGNYTIGKNGLISASTDNTAGCGYVLADVKVIPFANCVNGTAGSSLSFATSTFTAACRAGSNNLGGADQAIPNTGAAGQFMFDLPQDWNTSTQPYINIYYGSGANTSGTVIWTVSSACVDNSTPGGASDDPSFHAESAFASQTMAVANRMWNKSGQFTAVTSGNGCKVGSTVIIKVAVSGTAASNINAYYATVTTPRIPVVQAN